MCGLSKDAAYTWMFMVDHKSTGEQNQAISKHEYPCVYNILNVVALLPCSTAFFFFYAATVWDFEVTSVSEDCSPPILIIIPAAAFLLRK